MAKKNEKQNKKIPFIKAYMFILNDPDLIPAEKLVLLVVCRYLPDFCYHTNRQIAEICGFSERYVEKLVSRLKAKNRIRTGYSHTSKNGSPYTVRVIVPARVPKETNYRLEEASRTNGRVVNRITIRIGGRTIGAFYPNDRGANARTAGRPTKTNKNKIDSAASPPPAERRASAAGNKRCFRAGCDKIGVDYELDDTGKKFWWCEEHYPFKMQGKGRLRNGEKKIKK